MGLVIVQDQSQCLRAALAGDLNHLIGKKAVPVAFVSTSEQYLQGRGHTLVPGADRHALEPNMGHVMLPAGIHTPADLYDHIGIIDIVRILRLEDTFQFHGYTRTTGNAQVAGIRARAGSNIQCFVISGFGHAQFLQDLVEIGQVRFLYIRDQDVLP